MCVHHVRVYHVFECMFVSMSGKWTRTWILDNSLMRAQAKKWMIERVQAGATKAHGVFCISDLQKYFNTELLPKWEVPKNTIPRRAHNVDSLQTSPFLQISWSTARSWALALGARFSKLKKGYYVDGHDRADVLQHRKEWLEKERELELRQYRWVQLTLEQARQLNVPGYRQVSTTITTTLEPQTSKPKVVRRFLRQTKRASKPAEKTKEQTQREQHFKDLVRQEVVYPYTTDAGKQMVEVHVDLLSQAVRSKLATKLQIHGITFDMGGCLSVRFPRGQTPVIKVGTDEVIFKVCVCPISVPLVHMSGKSHTTQQIQQMYCVHVPLVSH